MFKIKPPYAVNTTGFDFATINLFSIARSWTICFGDGLQSGRKEGVSTPRGDQHEHRRALI